jgi:protein-disulfide isomerase
VADQNSDQSSGMTEAELYAADSPAPEAEINNSADNGKKSTSSTEVFTISREIFNTAVVALVFLIVGVFLGMNMRGDSGINTVALREIVREAVAEVSNQPSQVERMASDAPYLGPVDAPVVIIEFSDYLCPFCARHFENTLSPLLANYEGHIRYVYRDFPSVGGQNAVTSALAAHCASDQGLFWDYHNALFNNQQLLMTNNPDTLNDVLVNFAHDLDLDMDTFAECLISRRHLSKVIRASSDAQSIGARGTPAFLINGTFLSGAQDYEIFANLIDAELVEAGIEIPAPDRAG